MSIKIVLICNASSCSDIIKSINKKSYGLKVPRDNYLSLLGIEQCIKLTNSTTFNSYINSNYNVFSSITSRSLETALLSLNYKLYVGINKIEYIPYIEDDIGGIEISRLDQRNNDLLEHVKKIYPNINSKYINDMTEVKKNIYKYKTINIRRFIDIIKKYRVINRSSNYTYIIFAGRNFIYKLLKSIDNKFNNIIENTSIYEIELKNINSFENSIIKKKYPTVDDKKGYIKEEKYYFYKFRGMYIPLKDANEKLPFITEEMADVCMGRDILRRYISDNPYKINYVVSRLNKKTNNNITKNITYLDVLNKFT